MGEGIIPAYAGSTRSWCSRRRASSGSSPHTRGAPTPSLTRQPASGDHPRIRGEHFLGVVAERDVRGIIPAYAGSTEKEVRLRLRPAGSSPHTRGALVASTSAYPMILDHPRIRGEHKLATGYVNLREGIIPAYAGSTEWDKPFSNGSQGSSPHTRGAPMLWTALTH